MRTGGLLLCQPSVEQLLHRPRRFAKLIEADHARTALERVKGPAQRALLRQISGILEQILAGRQPGLEHFTGFLQEDVFQLHLVIVGQIGGQGLHGGWCRYGNGSKPFNGNLRNRRRSGGRNENRGGRRDNHRLNAKHRRRGQNDGRNRRFSRCFGRRDHSGHLHGDGLLDGHACSADINNRQFLGRLFAPHQRFEFAQFLVIDKELLGQRTLIAQHVDQEAHGPQAVAQLVKNAGARGLQVDVVNQELLDVVAHAQRGNRGLIESQNRKNTAHLSELTGHLVQGQFIQRIAKKSI